jgi:uncharacterized membrane protein
MLFWKAENSNLIKMADTTPNNNPTSPIQAAEQQTPANAPAEQVKTQPATPQISGIPISISSSAEQAKKAATDLTGQVSKMLKAAPNQPKVTTEEKLYGGLSYIPLAPIVTLMLKGDSGYVKLHGRQSLVLTGLFFVCIFFYLLPYLGLWLAGVIQFAVMVIGIFSMYQAFIGNWWKIPILGEIAELIPVGLFVQITKEAITGQVQPGENVQAPPEQGPSPTAPTTGAQEKNSTQQPPPAGTTG